MRYTIITLVTSVCIGFKLCEACLSFREGLKLCCFGWGTYGTTKEAGALRLLEIMILQYNTRQLKGLQDIVVASPGRLLQHMKHGNVFMSNVRNIVIDEVDTMLTQGFGNEIRCKLTWV